MKIKILGGHGGQSQGFQTTSFLINDELLIDAGAIASSLSVNEQAKIQHILVSHSHLDHIKDLAFICDNCFGMNEEPFHVYAHEAVIKNIKAHLFNDVIWPDFSKIPSVDNPTIKFQSVANLQKFVIKNYEIMSVKVNHPNDSMGFIIDDGESSVVFTLDTGATNEIWEMAKLKKNLKAIFTEVSFPSRLGDLAFVSQHHTPTSLHQELSKMPKDVPIVLTHLKPNFRDEILIEMNSLNLKRVQVLSHDGIEFNF